MYVAGWPDGTYIFIAKMPILVHFGRSWDGKFLCIPWSFDIFIANSVYFYSFGLFLHPILIFCTKKNLATPA
jgi:hypothetical protein